jgi:photosystem II stability/assembly factor-like uncharacterized protein
MAEERLRRNLEVALDPGPDFPGRLWISRTMAAIEPQTPRSTVRDRTVATDAFEFLRRGRRLAAVVAVLVIAAAATVGFLAIHSRFGPAPAHVPRFGISGPGAPVCIQNCSLATRIFTSEAIGWVIESRPIACATQPCVDAASPSVVAELFETTDGGNHWRHALTLGNHSAQQILASSDGWNVLVVGSPYDSTAALFHSTDSGQTWQTLTYPGGSGSFPAGDTVCVRVAPHVFFANPSEGWVIAQTDTYGSAKVYHTVDSGGHWDLTGTFDVKSQLNTDVVAGLPCKFSVSHELPGDFQFEDSTTGWYLPYSGSATAALVYRTQDGGLTWRPIAIAIPTNPAIQYSAVVTSLTFFNRNDGAALVRQQQGSVVEYIFQTSDGGLHWGIPVSPPLEGPVQLIDANHWVGWPGGGGWMRTSDAGRHWEVIQRAVHYSPSGLPTPDNNTVVPNNGLPPTHVSLYWYPSMFQFLSPSVGFANVPHESCHATSATNADCSVEGVSLYKTTDGGKNWMPLSLPDWH